MPSGEGSQGPGMEPCHARPHLLRQPLPAAEPFSVHHICTGLQLSIIVQPVRDVQDGGVRPRRQEEKEQDQGPLGEPCSMCSPCPSLWPSSHAQDTFIISVCCQVLYTAESQAKVVLISNQARALTDPPSSFSKPRN